MRQRGCLLAAGSLVLVVALVLGGGRLYDTLRIASLQRELDAELDAFYAGRPVRESGTEEGLAIDHHLAALVELTRLTSEASGAGVSWEHWGAWAYGREGPAFERIAAGARCREIGSLPYARRGVVDCAVEQQGLTLARQLVEVAGERDPARAVQLGLALLCLTGDLRRSAHASFQHDLRVLRERALRALEDFASSKDLPVDRIVSRLREDLAATRSLWTLYRGEYLARQVAFAHYLDQGTHGAPHWAKVPGKGLMGATGDADRGEVIDAWRAWRDFGAALREALTEGDHGPPFGARVRFREATVLKRLTLPGGTLGEERQLRARERALLEKLTTR